MYLSFLWANHVPAAPRISQGECPYPFTFSDRQSMIDHIDSNHQDYNISLLVTACDSVCLLAYGSGNPDITGIGVMISYLIQGITTTLLGPVLVCVLLFLDARLFDSATQDRSLFRITTMPSAPALKALVRLSRRHHKINLFIAVSVVLASAIRVGQLEPIAEVEFIGNLTEYQFYMCVASLGISRCILPAEPDPDNPAEDFRPNSWQRMFIRIYGIVFWAAYMVVRQTQKSPSSKKQVMQELTHYCKMNRHYPYVNFGLGNPPPLPKQLEDMGVKHAMVYAILFSAPLAVALGGGLLLWYFQRGLTMLARFLVRHWVRGCRGLRVRPVRCVGCLLFLPVASVWCILWALSLVLLQWERLLLLQATGEANQDSEWGFGQILAILVWLPLLEECIITFWDVVKACRSPNQQQIPVLPAGQPTSCSDSVPRVSPGTGVEQNQPDGSGTAVNGTLHPLQSSTAESADIVDDKDGLKRRTTWPLLNSSKTGVDGSGGVVSSLGRSTDRADSRCGRLPE